MLGIPYIEKTPVPTDYPCLNCHAHGPYCADFCVQLDAWREAQARHGKEEAKAEEHS